MELIEKSTDKVLVITRFINDTVGSGLLEVTPVIVAGQRVGAEYAALGLVYIHDVVVTGDLRQAALAVAVYCQLQD